MPTPRAALLALSLVFASVAHGERPDLSWLAGAWCGEQGAKSTEEHWLPERGGLMLGLNRTVAPGKTSFEFMRIEFTSNSARFVGQPGGAPPVAFELISAAANRVTFANPQHDFPKRVQYARSGDSLTARVDDGRDDGAAEEFKWTRCARP